MILGLIKSNFPGERRVALLPEDINNFENEILIEQGFGDSLDIDDAEYEKAGCRVLSRSGVFEQSDAIFSLKLIQSVDYPLIKFGQLIIGWTHPYGSGKRFMKEQAYPKELVVVDLDSNLPEIFYKKEVIRAPLPEGLFQMNSFYAGFAGTINALLAFGLVPDNKTKIAILGSGNVSQGAFNAISKFSTNVKMFYRRTMPIFEKTYAEYDVIINGIEVGTENSPILSLSEQQHLKK